MPKRDGVAPDWVPKSLGEVKAAYGLPTDAVFLGYVVHLPDSEEFLVSVQKFPRRWHQLGAGWLWAKHPGMAKVFGDHRAAWRVVQDCDRAAAVVHLFDVGDQFFVAFDG